MMSNMIYVILVLFVVCSSSSPSPSSSSFLFVEGGIITGFQRERMPVNVDDVVHTFERAQRYFQRHLQQEQEIEIEMKVGAQQKQAPVVEVQDEEEEKEEFDPFNNPTNLGPPLVDDEESDVLEEEEEFDPFNNPTNADPPFDDRDVEELEETGDGVESEPTFAPTHTFRPTELPVATTNIVFVPAVDAVEEATDAVAAPTPTVTTTNVMIGNPVAVAVTPTVTTTNVQIGNPDVVVKTPTVTTTNIKIGNPVAVTPTTATTTTSIKLGTTVHDDANPPSFTTKITTTAHPTVSPTTKAPTNKPTKKPSKSPTPKPYKEEDPDHHHDHESEVMKFKDIQVSRQQTGPRGGKKDPSPNIQPTELSFMIIMDDYNYSNDAETTHDIGIGTKFAFTGRIVTKAEELGTAVGTCTVTSDQNLNLSYCEVFHKISTDNYGGFGIVHTAGTADEVGGRFLITGTGGSLSKDAATDQGYAMVQFDPAGNPVLYVLLKLF